MPTIEFYGLRPHAVKDSIDTIRECFRDFDFRHDVVFVVRAQEDCKVLTWSGAEAPFVRIATRSPERAAAMQQRLIPHFDVETVIIGYHPRLQANQE